jgi:hypothetical protein
MGVELDDGDEEDGTGEKIENGGNKDLNGKSVFSARAMWDSHEWEFRNFTAFICRDFKVQITEC